MENASKKKRGRPRKYNDEFAKFLTGMHPGQTKRSIQNHANTATALRVLRDKDWAKWLFDPTRNILKNSLLAELGRLENDEDILAIAKALSDSKPSIKAAVARVRRFRLGKSPKASIVDLSARIAHVINDYFEVHRDFTFIEAKTALGAVMKKLEAASENQ